ncbi:unnamed protein product [Adineta ricciae]|uniref:Uncharacterized protein n=1 Tax=Adineta ricciae TaxID=249248 RepID=A0A815SIB2_ADIRI|nr:unnamed protein product [Adineta ricciae]CAF1647151.1 unnamed protein product [Adineta ricciae]
MVITFVCLPLAGVWRLSQYGVNPPAASVVALLALFSYVSSITMIGVAFSMVATLRHPKLYKYICSHNIRDYLSFYPHLFM